MTLTATGVAPMVSALSVKYRDCTHALQYFIQVWMYASPVVYPISMIPEQWRPLFALNPAVSDSLKGFRWAVLGHSVLNPQSRLHHDRNVFLVALFGGAFFFRRAERWLRRHHLVFGLFRGNVGRRHRCRKPKQVFQDRPSTDGLPGYRTLRDDLIGLPQRMLARWKRNGQLTSETFLGA